MSQRRDVNMDTQPEVDETPSELVSLSTGIVVALGFILGGLIGALLGHFWLDDAFGWGQDVTVGAVIGIIVGGALAITGERFAVHRLASRE
ncbi:MAG TPA: hypothetical protein VNZ55_03980 [Thermomicrobiales bacterium]|nr:hypothetical protein [Thermomicrobiales bacterium]